MQLKKRLKNKVLSYLVKDFLKSIKEEDILRMSARGGIMYRGKELSREEVDIIRNEAEILQNSRVLKLLLLDVEYLAQEIMFEKSTTYDDMMMGKAILYTTDILQKKIRNLAK